MKNVQLDEPLKYFVEQIREELGDRLKKIILFGSRARGDHDPDSDYDCLIVVDEVTSELKGLIYDIGAETLYRYNTLMNTIPVSQERYEQPDFSPLLLIASREGVIL